MLDFIETNSRREKIGKIILELIEYDSCYYEVRIKGKDVFITFNKDIAINNFEDKKEKLLRENLLNSLN